MAVILSPAPVLRRRHDRRPASQVDVHASGVLLGRVLQAELLAHLLDARFDLLDVVDRVVALADDAVRRDTGPLARSSSVA
jgi:hypothetical protein